MNNLEVFIIGDAGGIAALKLSDTEADLLIGGEVRLPGEVYFWQFCPVPSSWTWAVSSGGTELEVMELDHRSSTTKVAEHATFRVPTSGGRTGWNTSSPLAGSRGTGSSSALTHLWASLQVETCIAALSKMRVGSARVPINMWVQGCWHVLMRIMVR